MYAAVAVTATPVSSLVACTNGSDPKAMEPAAEKCSTDGEIVTVITTVQLIMTGMRTAETEETARHLKESCLVS
jgi:hypothetical protein